MFFIKKKKKTQSSHMMHQILAGGDYPVVSLKKLGICHMKYIISEIHSPMKHHKYSQPSYFLSYFLPVGRANYQITVRKVGNISKFNLRDVHHHK